MQSNAGLLEKKKATPRTSLFHLITKKNIEEQYKTALTKRKTAQEGLLKPCDEISILWGHIVSSILPTTSSKDILKEGLLIKESALKSRIGLIYPKLLHFYSLFVNASRKLVEEPPTFLKTVNDDVVYLAILLIQHCFEEIFGCFGEEGTKANLAKAQENYRALKVFHEFFFLLIKYKCCIVLKEKHLLGFQDGINSAFSFVKKYLLANRELNFKTEVTDNFRRQQIVMLIYNALQSSTVLAIFGEPPSLSAKKYRFVLEQFKTLFGLMLKYETFDKIFNEPFIFESDKWSFYQQHKYALVSFGLNRLSLFVQKQHSLDESTKLTLKYFVVNNIYKVLKVISQRTQPVLTEELLSVFAALINKNKIILSSIISTQTCPSNTFTITLLLNEHVCFIKTCIVNLCYFSANLDPMQRQLKYEAIKDSIVDCLVLATRTGMYCQINDVVEVGKLSVVQPKDFIAFLFKALMNLKKVLTRVPPLKNAKEIMHNICVLGTDLISRVFTMRDCEWLYKLYLLQFLSMCGPLLLKDRHAKYREEMQRIMRDSVDQNDPKPLVALKGRVHELALEIYVGVARFDPINSLQEIVALIGESYTNPRKLHQTFYALTCLLGSKVISSKEFCETLTEESKASTLFNTFTIVPEVNDFIIAGGLNTLYRIYKEVVGSYAYIIEQRKDHTILRTSSGDALARRSSGTTEINTYVVTEYLNKLDNDIRRFEQILDLMGSFMLTLYCIDSVAEQFLTQPEVYESFYPRIIPYDLGRSFIAKLITSLCKKLTESLNSHDALKQYVNLLVSILLYLSSNPLPFEDEKLFMIHLIASLESLMLDKRTKEKTKNIVFQKAVLTLLSDVCQRDQYSTSPDFFLKYIDFVNITAQDNISFYDTKETKGFMYSFIVEHCVELSKKSILTIESVGKIVRALTEIAFMIKLGEPEPTLIKEIMALEAAYEILRALFKKVPKQSNVELASSAIYPLELASSSLFNTCSLSLTIPKYLISILKRMEDCEAKRKLCYHIGAISSVNTTSKLLSRIMKNLTKTPAMVEAIINMVSGYTVPNLFYFDGSAKSYIRLKAISSYPASGLCYKGAVRVECSGVDSRMCLWSFLHVSSNELKGTELHFVNCKLVLRVVKMTGGEDMSFDVVIENMEFQRNMWHYITLLLTQKELIGYFDDTFFKYDLRGDVLPKTCNSALIGASFNPFSGKITNQFIGEISALYFFTPTAKFKECLKDIALNGSDLFKLFLDQQILKENQEYFQYQKLRRRKFYHQDIVSSLVLKVDPVDLTYRNKQSTHSTASLHTTKVYLNRPAKEIFHNLGGFKTCLPLLATSLKFTSECSQICNNMLRLLYIVVQNEDRQTIHFLVEDDGVLIIAHLLEKIGKTAGFDKELISLLFNVLEVGQFLNVKLAPLWVQHVIFNFNIWQNTDLDIVSYLIERSTDLILRPEIIAHFTPIEPFSSVLCAFCSWVSRIKSSRVMEQFTNLLLGQLLSRGKALYVSLLVERLNDSVSAKEILYLISLYQCQVSWGAKNIFENYIKGCMESITGDCPLVAALLSLISSAKDTEEMTVALAVHVLLSIEWDSVFIPNSPMKRPQSGVLRIFPSQEPSLTDLVKSKGDCILHWLNPQKTHVNVIELLLSFLFRVRGGSLRLQTYYALLSYVVAQPSLYSIEPKAVPRKIEQIKENEFNLAYFQTIYLRILKNITSFSVESRHEIVEYVIKFLKNPVFALHFSGSDVAFQCINSCLIKQEFGTDNKLKDFYEEIFVTFLQSNWRNRQKREVTRSTLFDFATQNPVQYLHLMNTFFDKILSDPLPYATDEGIYTFIQFAYSLEDLAILHPSLVEHYHFLFLLGKLVVLLNELRLLYFWLPSFPFNHFKREGVIDYSEPCYQREGGVVRVILRLLFGIILRIFRSSSLTAYQALALNLLDFFLYGKKKTLLTMLDTLGISTKLPSLLEPDSATSPNYFSFSLHSSDKQSNIIQQKSKLIGPDKSIVQHLIVHELLLESDSSYESEEFKTLFIIANLTQCILYNSLNIQAYSELPAQTSYSPPKDLSAPIRALSKILGKVCRSIKNERDMILQLFAEGEKKLPKYPIVKCVSDIEFCTAKTLEALRPGIEGQIKSVLSHGFVQSLFVKKPSKVQGKVNSSDSVAITGIGEIPGKATNKFIERYCYAISQVMAYNKMYKAQGMSKEEYEACIAETVLAKDYVYEVQSGLHELVTEPFVLIDKMIRNTLQGKRFDSKCTVIPKAELEKEGALKNLQEAVINFTIDSTNTVPKRSHTELTKRIKIKYDALHKTVFNEPSFTYPDKESAKIYQMAKGYYAKLCNRCPLYKSKESPFHLFTESFVKLDSAKDNLGRAMRLKPMKDPLKNQAVKAGLKYIRHFFLKRLLIRSVSGELLKAEKKFLIKNKCSKTVLQALVLVNKKARPRLSIMGRMPQSPKTMAEDTLPLFKDQAKLLLPKFVKSNVKAKLSKSQVFEDDPRLVVETRVFDAEIIKNDEVIFGTLGITETALIFRSKPKDKTKEKYRLGPSIEMSSRVPATYKKIWEFRNISRIMARRYNLVPQAIELYFTNHKSIFLVLFSTRKLSEFFATLQRVTSIKELISNPKRYFESAKYAAKWLSLELTTFEYLMLINDHSSRTFSDISQYPVFPWILQCDNKAYRDLSLPIAGISEHKRTEARKKYVHTLDLPGGPFQYGNHYLPGRAVLGYLMRLQPFAAMIYKFDLGEDSPSRKFHSLEKMWECLVNECDYNLELIPEFFYNPAMFYNLYFLEVKGIMK